ncbi:MAG: DUF2225 domain-containing protein [Lachnospiraceae bacterium]|nr:DUF2225 domain-containing protein [Lachnospiraceae bacterium]
MGILSGLSAFGLKNLQDKSIYEEEEKQPEKKQEEEPKKPKILTEADMVYDKTFECPVCGTHFKSKVLKTGKTRLVGTDIDLRNRYDVIDPYKYEVLMCTKCGYAAMPKYFSKVTSSQRKAIMDQISRVITFSVPEGEVYDYEEAISRYTLALACSMVKKDKDSTKGFICLNGAWTVRGYREYLTANGEAEKAQELYQDELEFLGEAYKGFLEARSKEDYPICGMDRYTIDYLVAVLAYYAKDYETAAKIVAGLLNSNMQNDNLKERSRELKDLILTTLKEKKEK